MSLRLKCVSKSKTHSVYRWTNIYWLNCKIHFFNENLCSLRHSNNNLNIWKFFKWFFSMWTFLFFSGLILCAIGDCAYNQQEGCHLSYSLDACCPGKPICGSEYELNWDFGMNIGYKPNTSIRFFWLVMYILCIRVYITILIHINQWLMG